MTIDELKRELKKYKGSPLSDEHRKFLGKLIKHGLRAKTTGSAKKTIQILRDDQKLAYINDTVVKKGGALIGYHFPDQPRPSDGCPPKLSSNLLEWACEQFACDPVDLYIDKRTGKSYNARRTYLLIKSVHVAFRALGVAEGGMDNVSPSDGSPQIEGDFPIAQAGAGFGDPIENKLTEEAAVQAVTKDYERGGWSVRSVERDKCGFDLECSKNGKIEHVEVKGSRGTEQSFIITSGEVRQAEANPNFVLAVVTAALSTSPKFTKYSGEEFEQYFDLSAIQYRAVLKR